MLCCKRLRRFCPKTTNSNSESQLTWLCFKITRQPFHSFIIGAVSCSFASGTSFVGLLVQTLLLNCSKTILMFWSVRVPELSHKDVVASKAGNSRLMECNLLSIPCYIFGKHKHYVMMYKKERSHLSHCHRNQFFVPVILICANYTSQSFMLAVRRTVEETPTGPCRDTASSNRCESSSSW